MRPVGHAPLSRAGILQLLSADSLLISNAGPSNVFLTLGDRRYSLTRPLVMGIVNVTPDSFSDGGRYAAADAAIAHARAMIADGADIIDLGAESTRPGAQAVSASDELARLLPVLDELAGADVALSVDTRNAATMRAVIARGVHLINDVNALRADGAVEAVAQSNVGICLMHMRGDPSTMQQAPTYQSVLAEVTSFLKDSADSLRRAGVASSRLLVDPGIGFGKTLTHNLELLRGIATISEECGAPVLVGLSRKSMLGALTGRSVDDRMAASVGGALAAAARGAAVLRVHDVAQTRDAITVFDAIMADESHRASIVQQPVTGRQG